MQAAHFHALKRYRETVFYESFYQRGRGKVTHNA